MPIIVAAASGAFCHLGHRGANKRARTVLRRRRSAVDKYNELPALHDHPFAVRTRASLPGWSAHGQQRPRSCDTAPAALWRHRWNATLKNFGQPSHLPAVNHPGLFWRPWGLDLTHRCGRFAGATTPLLTIWLAFLDELDNPVHPLAAECQQEPRLRRDTSTRGLSQIRAVNYSLLVRSAKRPRLVGPRGSLKRGVATV